MPHFFSAEGGEAAGAAAPARAAGGEARAAEAAAEACQREQFLKDNPELLQGLTSDLLPPLLKVGAGAGGLG